MLETAKVCEDVFIPQAVSLADVPAPLWITEPSQLPKAMGSYVLVMQLAEDKTIAIGKLGVFELCAGRYYYVGSAMGPGGLASRVGRYFRADTDKKLRWHVDYLRTEMTLLGCWVWQSATRIECTIAQQLTELADDNESLSCMAKVGSSDCRCPTHVFCSIDSI
jgi:Uri superfamily endonuclease